MSAPALPHESTVQTDGRRAARERNRLAVVDALLDLYAEGNLRPDAQEVAERSGVSRRSVFRYFDDRDDLDRTAIERQQQRVWHLVEIAGVGEGPLEERIARIAEQRVALFHELGPRYKNRSGGYTRIYKLAKVRQGDAAAMAVISLLGESEQLKSPTRPAVVSTPSQS